jgi:ribosomal protein L37E
VLGVNSFLIAGEQQNFNFITGTESLREYLEGQNVPLREAAPPAPSGRSSGSASGPVPFLAGGLPGGNVAWIVGGAALLLGVATTLLLSRRRTRPALASQQEYGQQYYGGQPHEQYYGGQPHQQYYGGQPHQPWPYQYSQPTASVRMDQGVQPSHKFCQRCGGPCDVAATHCSNCGSPWTACRNGLNA